MREGSFLGSSRDGTGSFRALEASGLRWSARSAFEPVRCGELTEQLVGLGLVLSAGASKQPVRGSDGRLVPGIYLYHTPCELPSAYSFKCR